MNCFVNDKGRIQVDLNQSVVKPVKRKPNVNIVIDSRVRFIRDSISYKNNSITDDLELHPTLENLHLSTLTPDLLTTISRNYPGIKFLQFENVSDDFCDILPLELEEPFNGQNLLPNLKILICPHNIKESVLTVLLANCSYLESLVICFAPEGDANHGITGKCFQFLPKSIKHLILGNLVVKEENTRNLLDSNGRFIQEIEILHPILDPNFDRVLELSNLRKLTFKACYCNFSQFINLSKLINLESLQIERLECMNDTLEDLFTPLFQSCNKLTEFKVSGVFRHYSHQLLEIISENNLKLTRLHIHPNTFKWKTYGKEMKISKSIGILTSMKNLQSLSLPHSDLDGYHLKSLLHHCPNLTTIDLSFCKKISEIGFIISTAEINPHRAYQIYLCSTKVETLPELPTNIKLCICNTDRFETSPLIPPSFYDLI